MKNGSGFGHVAMERPQSKLLLMNYVASRGETIRKKRTDDRWEGTAGSIAHCPAGSASAARPNSCPLRVLSVRSHGYPFGELYCLKVAQSRRGRGVDRR